MNLTPVGIDIAKTVFQVHYVDHDTGEVVNKPNGRALARTRVEAVVIHDASPVHRFEQGRVR
ncbi:transposase [Pandoraea sputorum]|uniref:Transposase n=1 Tax=Pandoraea sputorum TaxID=93222 RepID=A0A5E5BLD1_9BURK|nr:transposase [Pandoraea sputorum]